MATHQVIDSYPPFEYGTAVRWKSPDGSIVEGSICAFTIMAPDATAVNERSAAPVLVTIETGSGQTIDAPLDELEVI